MRLRGCADVARNAIAELEYRATIQAMREPLEEDARQLVLPQPPEMAIHRAEVVGRKQFRGAAVRQRQRRRAPFVGRQLGDIRPHVDANGRAAGRCVATEPMLPPAERRPVAGAAEPALIAEQQLTGQGLAIDGCRC